MFFGDCEERPLEIKAAIAHANITLGATHPIQ